MSAADPPGSAWIRGGSARIRPDPRAVRQKIFLADVRRTSGGHWRIRRGSRRIRADSRRIRRGLADKSAKTSSAKIFGGLVRGGHVRGGLVRGGHVRGGLVRGGHVHGGLVRGGHVRGGLLSAADYCPPKSWRTIFWRTCPPVRKQLSVHLKSPWRTNVRQGFY